MRKDSDQSDNLAQSWISNADAWTAAVRDGAIESRRLVTDQAIVNAVLAQQPRRMLDLGCGEGWLVRALSQQGVEGVGVDASPSLVEAAQSAGGGTFYVCTYSELADGSSHIGNGFDVVAANFALLQEDVGPLLQALQRSLVPRGKVVIQTVHPWSVGGAYRDGWREEDFRSFKGTWQPMPWYFRTLGSWVELLRECGFAIINIDEPLHPETQLPASLLVIAESKPT